MRVISLLDRLARSRMTMSGAEAGTTTAAAASANCQPDDGS
jgi:hypothetical protein